MKGERVLGRKRGAGKTREEAQNERLVFPLVSSIPAPAGFCFTLSGAVTFWEGLARRIEELRGEEEGGGRAELT